MINKAVPKTFPMLAELKRSFSIAMKRMRERERKQSGVKSDASHHSSVDKVSFPRTAWAYDQVSRFQAKPRSKSSKRVREDEESSSDSLEESDVSEDEQQVEDRRQIKMRKIDSDWSPFVKLVKS